MSKELPLEGYFACGGDGGRGLFMTPDCLGREFTSRTENYDFIIGMPQLGTFLKPPGKVAPPQWTYGPPDAGSRERVNERDRDPFFWGRCVGYHIERINVHLFRCRFYTSLTVSTAEEFNAAAVDFLSELEDWWTRFTSWVGILTSQDFVVLGGYPGAVTKAGSVSMWTSDAQRVDWRYPTRNHRIKIRPLELHDLEACVTATGNQEPPPAEWLFIRDARSLLDGGQNRRAVIEAATAAELAMTTLIDQYLATAKTDELVRRALMQQYSALRGRSDLLRRLRSGLLSDQLHRDLIQPRNNATHGGHLLTDAQAQTAVDMATDIVEEAHPLASLLPTQITTNGIRGAVKMNLRPGDYGLWMSCQHYSGYGRNGYEREHNLPSQWPGQRPRYVSAEISKLVAVCNELPPHRGHPFIARWDGENWETVGMVWDDGQVALKDVTRPEKYDRVRRGEWQASYPTSYPPFEAIAKDDAPTKFV